MAECGHCGKDGIGGIRDHIKDKHGCKYYAMGPDFRYYSYKFLFEAEKSLPGCGWLGEFKRKPHWEKELGL